MSARRHPAAIKALFAPLASLLLLPSSGAHAASGEEVYNRACQSCHATGVANAPKLGDRKAWQKLIAETQPVLTAQGYVGIRGMPPKGGDPTLSIADFSRATAFMARSAGADWKDPDPALLERIEARVKRLEAQRAAKAAKPAATPK